MSAKPKIEDAGEKLWGARKDMVNSVPDSERQDAVGGTADEPQYACLLDKLWPKPERWTDLIPQFGGVRAALAMVVREGLAKDPHSDNRHGFSNALWREAYEFAIGVMRGLIETPGVVDFDKLVNSFDEQVNTFALRVEKPPKHAKMWSYAIGYDGGRNANHPFHTSPINDLRWKYLHEWGWGQDPLVSDRLSMGALELTYQKTGKKVWLAVTGKPGEWKHLESTEFDTEREAIECARTYVDKVLLERQQELADKAAEKEAAKARKLAAKQGKGASDGETPSNLPPTPTSPMGWKRPIAPNVHLRTGFDRPAATDKTELDLIATFGFRGIEFGNWVTQGERRDFVNATYDALLDLVELLGMPPRFASLDGLLGLGYGSRGKGLSKIVAHFEPGNWVLHLTKDNGPGALAHEFAHAMDAWVAHVMWGVSRARLAPELATELQYWGAHGDAIEHSLIGKAFARWNSQIDRWTNKSDYLSEQIHGRPAWKWVQTAMEMDAGRKDYWATSPELLARAFEVLIHDSLALKGRTSHMLVHGVSQQDGLDAVAAGAEFPYPMGDERVAVCKELASVVRSIKAEYLNRQHAESPSHTP